jgi:hypothetical protein
VPRQQQRALSLVESLESHLRSTRSRAASCCSTRCALAVFVLEKAQISFINLNRVPQISSLPAPSTVADPSTIASRVSTGIQPHLFLVELHHLNSHLCHILSNSFHVSFQLVTFLPLQQATRLPLSLPLLATKPYRTRSSATLYSRKQLLREITQRLHLPHFTLSNGRLQIPCG